MGPQQMAILGESIFPWTTRSVSVCWGCALEVRSRINYRRFGTRLLGSNLRPRRHGSRSTTASSPHGGLSTLHKSLTTGSAVAWSDGRKIVAHGSKPVSIKTPPFPAELDRPYYGSRSGKQLKRRGTTQRLSKSGGGAGFSLHQLKPSQARNQGDDGVSTSPVPQKGSRTLKDGEKVPNPKRESEQTLDAVLDYWTAHTNLPCGTPSRGSPSFYAISPIEKTRPGWRLQGALTRIARSMKVQADTQKYGSTRLYSTKVVPVEARRNIQTVSNRLTAAARSEESLIPDDLPANLLPRFEVGSKTLIREHLRLWQEQNQEDETDAPLSISDHGKPGGVENMLTRPADSDTMLDTMDNEENEGPWPEASMDHDGVTEFDSEMPFLRCGDLVELSPSNANQESVLAIYVRTFDTQAQFYTMHGKWIHRMPKALYFSIPGFVPHQAVAEILPYLPSKEVDEELRDKLHNLDLGVPREVGSPIVNRMRQFFNASEAAYRKHSSSLDNAHDLVAHETDITYMTLPEIATKILPPSAKKKRSRPWPQATLYALHRILLRNEFGFVADRSGHRISGQFEIRPKQEVTSVNQVRSWFREYQEKLVTAATTTEKPNKRPRNAANGTHKPDNEPRDSADSTEKLETTSPDAADWDPIATFVSKARRLILESRENRVSTKEGNVGPSPVRLYKGGNDLTFEAVPTIKFSETDKSIIRFIEVWAGYRSLFRHVTLNSLASMMLRAIGMYEGYELDHAVGWLCLQELGVYAPWENRMILNHKLGLPGHQITREADKLRKKNIRAARSNTVMEDKMKAYRKDFGDLEVFCIDDADAREIDDGISVEEIPGSQTTYWIHVHVANPSAFISPESTLAKYAEYLTETVYLPERIYTMLPPNITRSQWSLAPGRPTLTFSAKVNRDGELLEAKITPAYIRNVSYCTPETIRNAVGEGGPPVPQTTITVGGEMPSRARKWLHQTLTESQKYKLRILQDLGNARQRQREQKGSVNVHLPTADVVVYLGPHQDTPLSLTNRTRSSFYVGDPVVQLRGEHFNPRTDHTTTAAHNLVPNMMVLACEAAALWCKERNIPTFYRVTQHNPDHDPHVFRKGVVQPVLEKLGYVPLPLAFRYSRLLGKSIISTTPKPHGVIGADQYAKCTSPLRRYGDLSVHWQVESAIRREAETGQTLLGSADQSYLTFSRERIEEMLPRVQSRERLIMGVKRHSLRHWTVQLLFRAFYFKEAALPQTFQCFILSKGASKYLGMYSGLLQGFGFDVQVLPDDSASAVGISVGDWWEVKLVKVDAYVRAVTVTTVRLIEKSEDHALYE